MFLILARRRYTANDLSVEYTDVCLRSKFKNKHWLFLRFFVCHTGQKWSYNGLWDLRGWDYPVEDPMGVLRPRTLKIFGLNEGN